MPTYVYQVILDGDEPGQIFEVTQRMSDDPLTHHPTTGQPVKRIPQAPAIVGDHTEARAAKNLSDDKLGKLGFTKYVKTDTGKYEKTAGKGPDKINRKTD
ncbi:FmdB family zinc ribbon protein [Poriferisphaera sp. WC338]|uniref:FmdB family zinc ribbon protein n=1 Tax=Poriferisphaera sp. WC338 TaxID=3425129 RepID=UPI003D81992C